MLKLRGKVAVVTGAGRGMGRVIALRLAKEGATVVVHYRSSRKGADECVNSIAAQGGRAVAIQADITRHREVQRLFQHIDRELGRLDIVVNSAGVSQGTPLAALDEQVVAAIVGVNFVGPLYVASEAAKRLKSGGRIINISSSLAEFPLAGSSVYAATRAAIQTFTESWAKELGPRGVTVNTVIPGATSPGTTDDAPAGDRESFVKASPFGRIGRADDIAAVVAFLCSSEASCVSGDHILANGTANP
jgi:3-oxoacyl-[acyl-carrier protein] reductase